MQINRIGKKETAFVLILSILLIILSMTIVYFFQSQYYPPEELEFSLDEGRHNGYNESWYVAFNLISDKGDEYNFFSVYGINDENRFHKLSALADISNDEYFYKMYNKKPDDYIISQEKLNITYDYFYGVDRWYQIKDEQFSYHFYGGLLDKKGEPIILNCTMISNKEPIRMKDSFLNKFVFKDESNNLFYYAQTNIDVQGTLFMNGSITNLSGSAWIDRQWGDTLFPHSYEWFAIQLNNDYEVAAAKIRDDYKNISYALLIKPDGQVIDLTEDIHIISLEKSKDYFSKKWFVSSVKGKFNLTIQTTINDQIVNMWPFTKLFEGGCTVSGFFNDKPIKGSCFSEQNP